MGIPCVPCVMIGWFDPGLQPVILGACPWQSAPLNRLYCGLDTHFFASSDEGDCLAPPPWRSRATTCRQGTSRLFQDAARRLSFCSRPATSAILPTYLPSALPLAP